MKAAWIGDINRGHCDRPRRHSRPRHDREAVAPIRGEPDAGAFRPKSVTAEDLWQESDEILRQTCSGETGPAEGEQ